MRQKSIRSLLLCMVLLAGLLSGCGGGTASGQPDAAEVPTAAARSSGAPPLSEYQRAIWYGFVPAELTDADPDETVVTWAQFCAMLGSMLELCDSGALSSWEAEAAGAPDSGMKRDGGMVALLFAAKAAGMARFNEPDTNDDGYVSRVWDVVSMDYPVFQWDTPVDLGDGCADGNHVGPAYDFCLRRVSEVSGKRLLEFDGDGDLRLEQPFTLREAALSAVRLYESAAGSVERLFHDAPRYVPLSEAAENTIGAEYLAMAEEWPAYEDMPATHAMILKPTAFRDLFGTSLIQRELIDMVADTGSFNAVHIGYECEFYYSDEDETIDLAYLENLDRVIEWCIERNLHVIWDFASVPGYAGGGANGDILTNPDHCRQALELMELFSARYADVPSGVLSFYILGEGDRFYFTEEDLVRLTRDLTAALRQSSPNRGVRANVWMDDRFGAFCSGWCEKLAETDTTVGFELYTMYIPALMGFPENAAANGRVYANGDKLTLKGDFKAGTAVTFLLTVADGVGLGLDAVISADGQEIQRLDCDTLDESHERFSQRDGEYYVHLSGYPLTVTLEADAEEIGLRCQCDDKTTMIMLANIEIRTPSSVPRTYPEFYHRPGDPVTAWRYVTDRYNVVNIPCTGAWKGEPLPLPAITVSEDGSFRIEQGENYLQKPDSIGEYVEKWARWSEETGTAVWVSESGYPITLPTEDRTAYMRCYAETLDKYDIGWTLFTDFNSNWGPIVHESALEENISEPPGSGYVKHGDFYWDEPVLEILREYLLG